MKKLSVLFVVILCACTNSDPNIKSTDNLYPESPQPVVETSVPQMPQLISVTYQASDQVIPNPERGFMIHTNTKLNDMGEISYNKLKYSSLTRSQPQRPPMSILHRYFILEDFVESDIDQSFLDNMQTDFNTVRRAGMKMVLRFSYNNQFSGLGPDGSPIDSFGDANKATILRHLQQLKPILHKNGDVIAFVEAGFIGIWGEWWFTDHFGYPLDSLTLELQSEYFNDRAEILRGILDAVPSNRMVLVRTVQYKQRIFGEVSEDGFVPASPLSLEEAYNQTPISRTGFHNDCFLTDEVDTGTFTWDRLEEERVYLAAETRFVPMGGETCQLGPPIPFGDPSTWDPTIRYLCPTALKELEYFHWSFLNIDWYRDVIDTWKTGIAPHNCFDEIARRLGYRFVLLDGTYSDIVKPGDQFEVNINIRNDGFAAPYNPRLVEIVLRNIKTGQLHTATLPDDPRNWQPSDSAAYSLNYKICTPSDLPTGEYDLLFNLPDPEPTLYRNPPYSIQLANQNVWESSTGFNNLLHTLSVSNNALSLECSQDSVMLAEDINTP